MGLEHYRLDDTTYAEQFNTLIILDDILSKSKVTDVVEPSFIIVGGTAILFHGIDAVVTIDIDCANKIPDKIKDLCGELITDMASSVICFPKNYEERLVRFEESKIDNMKIFLPSIEDLVITKLHAGRMKDMQDIKKYKLLEKCNYDLLVNIIETEMSELTDIIMDRLKSVS